MKCLLVICLLGLLAVSLADESSSSSSESESSESSSKRPFRGCRTYINGRCEGECPEGTHTYSSGCKEKVPEPTCDEPNPKPEEGRLCDYFACYCNPPTVRDTINNKCVPLEECPKKE